MPASINFQTCCGKGEKGAARRYRRTGGKGVFLPPVQAGYDLFGNLRTMLWFQWFAAFFGRELFRNQIVGKDGSA